MLTLYNKRIGKRLTHPKLGLWYTNDLSEARSMLDSLKSYLQEGGLETLLSDFVVIDVDTGEEVNDCDACG